MLSYFLGVEISFSLACYYLKNIKYALYLLSRTRLTNSKIANTPMKSNTCFTPQGG